MPILTLPPQSATSLPTLRAKALVFDDPRSQAVLSRLEQIAPSEATVLLMGETGTGKEIIARHIHQLSRRAQGPFVAINCGAFSENLVESELFGHEKGSFTGALQSKAGWFEAASGGTLFLDEVGDLPLSVQVKLLRVLQESEVVRLGSRRAIRTDVRLVAATNVDLQEAMLAGNFREDLYYRLNVAAITLPPLRERPGDVAPLAHYFVDLYRRRMGMAEVTLSEDAQAKILAHTWPGNIRELENALHHALLVCRSGTIHADDLRLATAMGRAKPSSAPALRVPATQATPFEALEHALSELYELPLDNLHERIEEMVMRTAYRHCEQNQLQTARLLGISRNIVRARLIKYGDLAGQLRSPSSPPPPSSEAPISSRASFVRVRIGYQNFGQLLLVKALGGLDRALLRRGLRVEWVEFPGGMQLMDALQNGVLDLGVVGECPPVFAQAADAPIVYLAAEHGLPQGEAILVPHDSKVAHVSQLRGKTVALNRGANVHYLLIRALEEAGVPYHDVNVRFLAPRDARRAFVEGDVDAWAIWEPLLGAVKKELGARVLRDGSGLTQNNAYYVARRDLTELAPEVIEVVLQELDNAARYGRNHPKAAADLIALENNVDGEALEHWLTGFSPAVSISSTQVDAQQQIADSLFALKLVAHPVRIADAQWGGAPQPHLQAS